MKFVSIFPDGSFNGKNASWAFVVIENNQLIHQEKGILYGDINYLWNVGGEITAVQKSVDYCIDKNVKANIIVDYKGCIHWVGDLFGKQVWKCKNRWTREYRDFIVKNKDYINSMSWVKGHATSHWNNYVDQLAKI